MERLCTFENSLLFIETIFINLFNSFNISENVMSKKLLEMPPVLTALGKDTYYSPPPDR